MSSTLREDIVGRPTAECIQVFSALFCLIGTQWISARTLIVLTLSIDSPWTILVHFFGMIYIEMLSSAQPQAVPVITI